MENAIIIRKYIDGDETAILKLLKEVFDVNRTKAYWDWLFHDNRFEKSWRIVAEIKGQVVAQYAITRTDLNYMGQRIVGGQSLLTMVHPGFRKNRLFLRLATCCYENATAEGLRVVFGVPNRSSYPGLVRHLGWRRIADFSYFVRRIGYRKVWGGVIDKLFKFFCWICLKLQVAFKELRFGKKVVVSTTKTLPDDVDDMLREMRNYQVLSVWKDADYLKWRYEKQPDSSYLFHTAKIAEQIQTIIVTKLVSRGGYISIAVCEFLHRNNDEVPSQLIINHIISYYMRTNAQRIEFYGHDAGYFNYTFSSCGFKVVPYSSFVFVCRVFSDRDIETMSMAPHNWTIVYGDTDQI